MDSRIQGLMRRYQSQPSPETYNELLQATLRAGLPSSQIPHGSSGQQLCPRCTLDKLGAWPETHPIHQNIRQFFATYTRTNNSTYLLKAAVGDDAWLPALYFILSGLAGNGKINHPHNNETPYIRDETDGNKRFPGELVGQGELCWGHLPPWEKIAANKGGYGFEEWPTHRPNGIQNLEGWCNSILQLENASGADLIEIELVPFGSQSIKDELGPINFNQSMLSYLRLTFLTAESEHTNRYESLFILSIPITWQDEYGHDFHKLTEDEIPEGVPEGRSAWECPGCTLFVMTEGETQPRDAATIYLSCGSFDSSMWENWNHETYLARMLQEQHGLTSRAD